MLIAVFIGIFVLIGIFLIVSYIRRRGMAFEGTITDKDVRETQTDNGIGDQPGIRLGGNGQIRHDYIIKVETAPGKVITWKISQGKYEIAKIGDHVSKAAGTTDVEITPQAPATPVTPPTATTPPSLPPAATQ